MTIDYESQVNSLVDIQIPLTNPAGLHVMPSYESQVNLTYLSQIILLILWLF